MMKLTFRSCLATIVAASMLTGCATILSGGSAKIQFETDGPEDTEFVITGVSTGDRITRRGNRFTVDLKRGSDYQVSVKAQGYQGQEILVGRGFNMIAILNVLFWPGIIIDWMTGAMFQPDRERVMVYLAKAKSSGSTLIFPVVFDSESGAFDRNLNITASAIGTPRSPGN